MTQFTPGTGPEFRPPSDLEFNYRLDVQIGYYDYAGSSSTATTQDAIVRTTSTDYSDPYYDFHIIGQKNITISLIGEAGLISGNRVNRVSDGTCQLLASHIWLSRGQILSMSRINANTYTTLDGYVSGSLAKHVTTQTIALIGSHTADDMPIYSIQNHASASYVRNVNCWAYPLDLTAISPWNSRGAQTRAGVAITPRHVLAARHYPLAVSDTIRFITSENAVVDRTVEAVYNVPEATLYAKDVQIVLLDSDLPGTITPVKFLPANVDDYLPSWGEWSLPFIYTNQFERMACAQSRISPQSIVDYVVSLLTTEAPYATMYEQVIVGDSGSPAFVVISGTPVLVCHWTYAGMGAAHHQMLTEIALAITTLGGGYSPTTVDLSSFTDYS